MVATMAHTLFIEGPQDKRKIKETMEKTKQLDVVICGAHGGRVWSTVVYAVGLLVTAGVELMYARRGQPRVERRWSTSRTRTAFLGEVN